MNCNPGINSIWIYNYKNLITNKVKTGPSWVTFNKECSNYRTIALISHASKVMLKIHQARLQQYMNHELPDVQAGFRKGRGTRDQTANICWIIEKAREFQKKTSISALLTMPKPLTVWITTNCGKFWNRWEYQTTWPASRDTCMQVRKQQLELDMEQQTGSKQGKEYVKAVYCHPAYLTYMQSILSHERNYKLSQGPGLEIGRVIFNAFYWSERP